MDTFHCESTRNDEPGCLSFICLGIGTRRSVLDDCSLVSENAAVGQSIRTAKMRETIRVTEEPLLSFMQWNCENVCLRGNGMQCYKYRFPADYYCFFLAAAA